MNKNIFVFSSPLQFLFSLIIFNELKENVRRTNFGYFYNYKRNFEESYRKIINVLNIPAFEYTHISNFDHATVSKGDHIFLGNRFNRIETALFDKLQSKNIYLYEEGFNIYLKHHFTNEKMSDSNIKLRVKNYFKSLINRTPSHIRLSDFIGVYSTFRIEHLPKCTPWKKINFNLTLSDSYSYNNACLFLDQSLVEDRFVSSELLFEFLINILTELQKKYDTVFYKPHPRTDINFVNKIYSTLGDIQDLPQDMKDVPAEIFIIKNPNIDVVGFSSSTLIYSSSLFGNKTYQCLSILRSLDSNNARLSKFADAADDLFKKHQIQDLNKNL